MIKNILFPRKCIACGAYLDKNDETFCKLCKQNIERPEPPYCMSCFKSLEYCKCNKRFRAYDCAVAPFYYDGAVKSAVLRLKFSSKEHVAVHLAKEMSGCVNSCYFGIDFDIVTCVPGTRKSIYERGYNQSQSLAEYMSIKTVFDREIEYDFNLLTKSKDTAVQHLLSAESRRKNIESAYRLNSGRCVQGKNILLIDDILTTGATLEACSRELKLHGAKAVYAVVAAFAK